MDIAEKWPFTERRLLVCRCSTWERKRQSQVERAWQAEPSRDGPSQPTAMQRQHAPRPLHLREGGLQGATGMQSLQIPKHGEHSTHPGRAPQLQNRPQGAADLQIRKHTDKGLTQVTLHHREIGFKGRDGLPQRQQLADGEELGVGGALGLQGVGRWTLGVSRGEGGHKAGAELNSTSGWPEEEQVRACPCPYADSESANRQTLPNVPRGLARALTAGACVQAAQPTLASKRAASCTEAVAASTASCASPLKMGGSSALQRGGQFQARSLSNCSPAAEGGQLRVRSLSKRISMAALQSCSAGAGH